MDLAEKFGIGLLRSEENILDILRRWAATYPHEVTAIAHKTKDIRDGLINRKGISREGNMAHLAEIPATLHGMMCVSYGPQWVQDKWVFNTLMKNFKIGRVANNPVSEKGFLE